MKNLNPFLLAVVLLVLLHRRSVCEATSDCQYSTNNDVVYTITVGKSGLEKFTAVQTAIDSIPESNTHWIRIRISPGKYTEKVTIPVNKPCILLEGAGRSLTSIEWGDHRDTFNTATFTSYPDNVIAKGITFKNTYNLRTEGKMIWRRAMAAKLEGDKYAFDGCGFVGIQDTLLDYAGHHYFYKCYIEGAIDFIFGNAQSIYKKCVISVNIGKYNPGLYGSITAQKKEQPEQKSGFVFKNCVITGTGKTYLGRAWGPYSTVIVYKSRLSDVIVPEGWNAWRYTHHEANFTYVEADNIGKGADMAKRVPWEKKLSSKKLHKFLDISFIDGDGWLHRAFNL